MPKKALIIDNDRFFVEFLSETLKERGLEIIKAYDGKEGITRLEEGLVDFVFVDMIMPKIDGIRFIKYIRTCYPGAKFPVIAVSANAKESMKEILEAGADYCIPKGPMEKMAEHIHRSMERIEAQPKPGAEDEKYLEPGRIYKRRVTVELLDLVKSERAIFESAGVAVFVLDKDTSVISANSMALEMAGRPFEELLNRPLAPFFPKDLKEKIASALDNLTSNPDQKRRISGFLLNGKEIRAIISLYRIDDEMCGWVVIMDET